jgi:PAS domain S-box-containing protein
VIPTNDLRDTLSAPGEMAKRINQFDWSKTPLGALHTWPQSLRTSIDIALNSRFPFMVWWGSHLINLYNDAYIPLLGKRHPDALGRPAKELWSDIWPIIEPQVDAVMQRGESTWNDRVHLPMHRNDVPEDAWFTWSYGPVRDERGTIAGLLSVVIENTAEIKAERERELLIEQRGRADEQARSILESVTDAFFAVDRQWCFSYVNPQSERMLGRTPGDLIGHSIWEEYPGLIGSVFENIYHKSMNDGVPGSVTSFYPDHNRWYEVRSHPAPDGISIYFRDVSEQEHIQRERTRLAAEVDRQVRVFDSTLSSISDFAYTLDRDARFVYVNKPLLDLWGIPLEQAIGKDFFDLKYPEDLAAKLARQVRQVFETNNQVIDETPYTNPVGAVGYYEYILSPVFGPDGAVEMVAGTTRVITERKRLELEREQLLRALDAERSNLASIVDKAPAFIATLRGPDHIIEVANDEYYNLIGRRDVLGKPVRIALPEVEGQGFFELLDNVYRTGVPFVGNEVPALLGPAGAAEQHYVNFVYQALRDPDGNISGVFAHGIDVTSLVRSRQTIQASEKQRRLALDAAELGAWHLNPKTHDLITDQRFRAIYGVTADHLTYDQVVAILHPDDRARIVAAVAAASQPDNPVPYDVEHRVVHPDGSIHWVYAKGRATFEPSDAGVTLVSFDGTIADITERKRIEDERRMLFESEQAARSEAERASRMKDEFLATLSHEIRTPLNAILGWSQIMRTSTDPDDIATGLDVIERNARSQSQIIEDLLDMSRIISGKVRLDVQRVDLSAIVQAAVDTARPTAEAKGVRLNSILDPLTSVTVSGDPSRLQQILWNLISNAVKFTPKGGRVQVLLERVNSHLEISVVDTGEGIPPEFLPFVFDRFRQADASTTRRHGGLGLGLSIVKQLVELHGGSVRVKSAGAGQGTTFIVALPLLPLHPETEDAKERRHPRTPAAKPTLPAETGNDIAGVRVLVVDDEPDARALVKRLLEDCHAVVTSASSADEALQHIRTGNFDVLISDIGMPGQDGYALIKRIRVLDKSQGGALPAIALTAYARAEDRIKAISAGFLMHVAKPVEAIELITMVAAATGRTGR